MAANEEKNDEMMEVRIDAGVCNPHVVTTDVSRSWYEENKDICHPTNSQREKDRGK